MITQQNIWAQLKDLANSDIFEIVGTGAPIDGTTGKNIVGLGGFYVDSASGNWYVNVGTKTSPVWVVDSGLGVVTTKTGTIASADITGTSAGQLGHANGYPIVPAPGANKVLWPLVVICSLRFNTAAYTGGGTGTSIGWGGGNGNISALVTAANFIQAAADRLAIFQPTTAAVFNGANATFANISLNLIQQAAPTQPGTAAGILYYKAIYTVQNLNQAA